MRESVIEKHLSTSIKALGGMCIKLQGIGLTDRLVLMNGKCFFVELKRENGKLSAVQQVMQRKLRACGMTVVTLYSKEEIDEWISNHVNTNNKP